MRNGDLIRPINKATTTITLIVTRIIDLRARLPIHTDK